MPSGRLASVTLFRVAVSLRHAHGAAHGTETLRRVILCRVTNHNGQSGWGECPTLDTTGYVTETTEESWDYLVNGGVERILDDAELLTSGVPAVGVREFLPAQGCVLDAAYDMTLKAQNTRLVDAIASHIKSTTTGISHEALAPRAAVDRTTVIASVHDETAAVLERARGALGNGAALIKLKVDAQTGIDQVIQIAAAIGPKRLAVDANGSFNMTLATHRSLLEQLDQLDLAYIEQPLSHKLSWPEMQRGLSALTSTIVFDESICAVGDIAAALQSHQRACVSIKPARLGGVRAAVHALLTINEHAGTWFVGGMLELGVGRATALAVAAQLRPYFPTDLGPSSQYVTNDITEAVVANEVGEVIIPDGHGCGRTPQMEHLDVVTEQRWDYKVN